MAFLLYWVVAPSAIPCDDPPNHYPEPCKAAYLQNVPYFPVGEAAGIFKNKKIDIRLQGLSLVEARRTLPDVPLTQTTAAEAILARLDGHPIRIIATLRTTASITFYSKQSISLADLKGNKVAVGAPGFGYGLAVDKLLKDSGFRGDHMSTVDASMKDRIAAAMTGNVGAFAVYSPFGRQVMAQYPQARAIGTVNVALAGEVLIAPEKFIEDRRNDKFYRDVLSSISEVYRLLRESASAKQWLEKAKIRGDLDAYAAIFQPTTERVTLNKPAIDATIADLRLLSKDKDPRLAKIRVDDLVALRYIDAR
jgi:ABC-type nitrate/sulfonate/bicarbonate transport system substrate-binding protein